MITSSISSIWKDYGPENCSTNSTQTMMVPSPSNSSSMESVPFSFITANTVKASLEDKIQLLYSFFSDDDEEGISKEAFQKMVNPTLYSFSTILHKPSNNFSSTKQTFTFSYLNIPHRLFAKNHNLFILILNLPLIEKRRRNLNIKRKNFHLLARNQQNLLLSIMIMRVN